MSQTTLAVALAAAAILAPFANATGLVPVNPVLNGDFEVDTAVPAAEPLRPYIDQCFGIGHQVNDPVYSSWGDWAIETANDPENATIYDARVANGYWVATAGGYAADPASVYECGGIDNALVNPSEKVVDPGFMWSNDPATTFGDFDGDGDREARIPKTAAQHNHNLWQSVATTTQAFSADFDAFTFRLESGVLPAGANVQVGLALSPGYIQSPFVGTYWEGAVLFRANDLAPDANGLVSADPVAQGEIICPAYAPCVQFRNAYNAADEAGKRTLLGQARIVQTSLWSFSGGVGPVVVDDVGYVGAKTAAETTPRLPVSP